MFECIKTLSQRDPIIRYDKSYNLETECMKLELPSNKIDGVVINIYAYILSVFIE